MFSDGTEDCISGRDSVEDELECRRIESAISDFLWRQEESARAVFIRRYWYFDSIDDICRRTRIQREQSDIDSVPDAEKTESVSER